MPRATKSLPTNIHGIPLSEIEKLPTDGELARIPRIPLHKYPDLPLYQDEHLRVLVKGSRVSLDSLAGLYRLGKSVDYLSEGFPSVERHIIQEIIDFYHQERVIVDEYLDYNEKLSDISRKFWESNFGGFSA